MAFIEGLRLIGGWLAGSVFDFAVLNANDYDWRIAPGSIPNYDAASMDGAGSGFGGIVFDPYNMPVTGWGNKTLAGIINIKGYSTTDYKRELRFYLDRSAVVPGSGGEHFNWRVTAVVRVYSTATTYADTTICEVMDIQWWNDNNAKTLKSYLVFGNITYQGHHYILIGESSQYITGSGVGTIKWNGEYYCVDYNTFFTAIGGDVETLLEDPDFGPAAEEDGYGPDGGGSGGGSGGPGPTFDGESDPWVDYALKPGIASLGLVNLYKCDVGSLVNLGAELFPDIHWPTSLQDVGEVLAAVSDSIWNSKLIDYIVSAHIIPVDVTGGNLTDIKVGTRTMTGIMGRPITDDIVEFDCGSLHIDEYYTNFVDYRGTRCRIYIPFHGFIEIKPEYWQSATLSLKYRFNVIDGSFVAMLYSTVTRHQKPFTSLIGQYTGCACVHVPMTGAEYASMFSGMISGAGGAVTGLSTGNAALAATSALNGAAAMGAGGNVQMSNAYNASAGFYGHPCPYVIIERQVSHFSTRYNTEQGLPLIKSMTIGSCHGLTICDDVVLNFGVTDEIGKEIIAALKEGVIV